MRRNLFIATLVSTILMPVHAVTGGSDDAVPDRPTSAPSALMDSPARRYVLAVDPVPPAHPPSVALKPTTTLGDDGPKCIAMSMKGEVEIQPINECSHPRRTQIWHRLTVSNDSLRRP